MERSAFEKLEIYRLSELLSDATWALVRPWSRFHQDTLGKQLIRAGDSIRANIAEGFGRGTPKDHRHFIHIARGSLYETKHWLRRAYARELINASEVKSIKPILEELAPRLNAYLNSIRRPKLAATNNLQPTTHNRHAQHHSN